MIGFFGVFIIAGLVVVLLVLLNMWESLHRIEVLLKESPEIKELTETLKAGTDSLEKTVQQNQPNEKE